MKLTLEKAKLGVGNWNVMFEGITIGKPGNGKYSNALSLRFGNDLGVVEIVWRSRRQRAVSPANF